MGQILHGSATTTAAIRRAIQHSQESLRALARRYGVNPKTIAKWKARTSVADRPTGPKAPTSTVLSSEDEVVIVAFRRRTLLPLDDCLYAPQPSLPHLTRSSMHRCLQRHSLSRLPDVDGDKPIRRKFKAYAPGYVHIDIAEVRTAQASCICSSLSTGVARCAMGGIERRRRWSVVEKMRIVTESLEPGAKVSEVARRNDVAPSVLFTWRGTRAFQ